MEEPVLQRNRFRAGIVVLAVAFLLTGVSVWFAMQRETTSTEDAAASRGSVRKRIETLFEAAESGNVDRYLGCFADPLRSEIAGEITGGDVLKRSESKLRGFVCPPDTDTIQTDDATIVVEKIYEETSVRVRFDLRWIDGEWKITAMQPIDRTAPVTKYGTPVIPLKR